MEKFTDEQLVCIWREEGFNDSKGNWQDALVMDKGNWQDGGKYSNCIIVFKYLDAFYQFTLYRYGSYFTSYEYEVWDEATKVELKEYEKTITVRRWVAI